jgi:hypothetical protein
MTTTRDDVTTRPSRPVPARPRRPGKRRGPAVSNPRFELAEKQVEALTVAMVVAPGVYARNRLFDLLSSPGARRAKTRAAIIRGLLPQLARANTVTLESEPRGAETHFVLRYAIAALRLTRVVELSSTELAALRLVAERSSHRPLPPCLLLEPDDRGRVTSALTRLLDGDLAGDVARLAREIVAPPGD